MKTKDISALLAIALGNSLHAGEPAAEQVATAEDATLFPIPSYSGDLWERAALTGDWGGSRTRLAERGIQLDATLQQYLQGVVDGGRSTGWEYSGTADFRFKLDTSKAGLWAGGFLEVHAETYFGNLISPRSGAVMSTNTDYVLSAPHGSGTYLSHIVFTQFLAENFAVVLGKLDTTVGDANAFAHGTGDQKFQNLAFSFNPVTLMSAPYSPLGAAVMWIPKENLVIAASAYDMEGDLEEHGFDTVFKDGTGFNLEIQVTTDLLDKPGHHLFGGTYGTGDLPALSDLRLLLPAFEPMIEDGTWNLYYNFDQYLVAKENGCGWGVFGRIGFADDETNPIPFFASLGLGGTGLGPNRPEDRYGLGVYYLEISNEFPNIVQRVLDDSEYGLEFFYDVEVAPSCRLAVDLQIINPATKAADTGVVAGIRSRITF